MRRLLPRVEKSGWSTDPLDDELLGSADGVAFCFEWLGLRIDLALARVRRWPEPPYPPTKQELDHAQKEA